MEAQAIFQSIIRGRKIMNLADFLNPDYSKLSNPLVLSDMNKAIVQIKKTSDRGQMIGIYGDYDLDGLAAAVLLHDGMKALGMATEIFIPNRFLDGYGLSRRGIDYFKSKGVRLMITVDCGSQSHDEVDYAKRLGMRVIISDHHEMGNSLAAAAVINPRRPDSRYPFRDLAGVGVAFQIVRALSKKTSGLKDGQEKWLLDLVALGTISDVVDLTGENRILAYWGLKVLNKTRRIGLKTMLERLGANGQADEETIGYYLAPRLNAAGRLEGARAALALLMAKNDQQARRSVDRLEALNTQRRQEQEKIYRQALTKAYRQPAKNTLVLVDKRWSHGINGIVAAKISERLDKPVFILQDLCDGTAKGSGRSPGAFSLAEALRQLQPLIISGGGHHHAAGVTIATDRLKDFSVALDRLYHQNGIAPGSDDRSADYDYRSENLKGLSLELVRLLGQLRPYGPGNRRPRFRLDKVRLEETHSVGAGADHLKGSIVDRFGHRLPFIAFNITDHDDIRITSDCCILATLEKNTYLGKKQAQLNLLRFC